MRPAGSRRPSVAAILNGLIAVLVALSAGVVALDRGVPLTGRQVLVVAGASMTPAIAVGSAIVVEPVDPADLIVGDVVSLRTGPERAIVTHRIVRIVQRDGARWLETKGDANEAADPAIVPASAVLGRVGLAIPFVGYLVALTSTISGLVLIGALVLLLTCLVSLAEPRPAHDARAIAV